MKIFLLILFINHPNILAINHMKKSKQHAD